MHGHGWRLMNASNSCFFSVSSLSEYTINLALNDLYTETKHAATKVFKMLSLTVFLKCGTTLKRDKI